LAIISARSSPWLDNADIWCVCDALRDAAKTKDAALTTATEDEDEPRLPLMMAGDQSAAKAAAGHS
jgi:hypothetical protein